MIALSVYRPGCEPPKPERFGLISIDQALAVARRFAERGACVDVYEHVIGGAPRLVQRLEPEGAR